MGQRRRPMKLRDLVGAIKDKATQSKAAILSKPEALISLLRATSHDPHAPPDPKDLAAVLALSRASRAAASTAVEALMDRLRRTRDAYVALKCLLAAHHVAASGGFILRDQLAVVPAGGGRNYLNLAGFRDGSSHVTWELSTWVRWYGGYVEALISASRVLGFFLGERSEGDFGHAGVSAETNAELVRETESLVGLVEEICKRPEGLSGGVLVDEIRGLVGRDCVSALAEISVRVAEFGERLSCLSFGDSVELVCALKRLEDCRERLGGCEMGFWDLVREVRERVGSKEREERLMVVKVRRKDMGTESARFGDRVMKPGESVRFGSGRLEINGCGFSDLQVLESMKSCA